MLANSGAVSAAGVLNDDLLLSVFSSDAVVNKGVFNRSFGTRPHWPAELTVLPRPPSVTRYGSSGNGKGGDEGKEDRREKLRKVRPSVFWRDSCQWELPSIQ